MTDIQRWRDLVDNLNRLDQTVLEIMSLGDGFETAGTVIRTRHRTGIFYIPHNAPVTDELLAAVADTEDSEAKFNLLLNSGVIVEA